MRVSYRSGHRPGRACKAARTCAAKEAMHPRLLILRHRHLLGRADPHRTMITRHRVPGDRKHAGRGARRAVARTFEGRPGARYKTAANGPPKSPLAVKLSRRSPDAWRRLCANLSSHWHYPSCRRPYEIANSPRYRHAPTGQDAGGNT